LIAPHNVHSKARGSTNVEGVVRQMRMSRPARALVQRGWLEQIDHSGGDASTFEP
jgi:hypothetical protein